MMKRSIRRAALALGAALVLSCALSGAAGLDGFQKAQRAPGTGARRADVTLHIAPAAAGQLTDEEIALLLQSPYVQDGDSITIHEVGF